MDDKGASPSCNDPGLRALGPRRWALALGSAALLTLLLVAGAGELLSRSAPHAVGEAPQELNAQTIHLPSTSGQVSGWFSPGRPGRGAVLLLHGVRSHRGQMLARARLLHEAGLGVLLIDLPAHGESSGQRISFGWRESQGVAAALHFLRRELPQERLGVIGLSLGGASLLLLPPAQRGPLQAVVLESVYPTIEEAVHNRLRVRIGEFLSRGLTPLLLSQLPLRLGVEPAQLRPEQALRQLDTPVLVAGGQLDTQTPPAETQRMAAAAPQLQALWLVEGAHHTDLQAFAPEAYRQRVLAFLIQRLRADAAAVLTATP
ncbi:alpha/beta hydrolase [Roseateles sp.]|uniref:alpha/beta hydrolase n=1 Tax=Roseateles sp. TaxID=1971397 RepID=UPI003D0F1FA8